MKRWLAGTAAACWLGLLAGPASAQMPNQPIQPVVHDMRLPSAQNAPAGNIQGLYNGPVIGQPGYGSQPPVAGQAYPGELPRRPLMNHFNRIGSMCFATHNSPGCSSCWAEYIFQFGTCRQFFGEGCLPYPPVGPIAGHFGGSYGGAGPYGSGSGGCATGNCGR